MVAQVNPINETHAQLSNAIVSAIMTGPAGVLLLRRSVTGEWTLPGGKAEGGESPETAMEREILEETGIALSAQEKQRWRQLPIVHLANGSTLVYFVIRINKSPLVSLRLVEHDSYLWVTRPSDLPEWIHPGMVRQLLFLLPWCEEGNW